MAEKLIWSELRRMLATRADVSEKDANTFLTALNAHIIDALKRDKQVKINGLGTFKLQAVAPRKSVNVTTGEEIIIEGYNKVVFNPEASLKELVESSTVSDSQTVTRTTIYVESETMDPLKKLGAQAEEIVDLLSDLGQEVSPQKSKSDAQPEEPEQPEEVEEPVVPEEPAEPEQPEEVEEPIVPEEQEEPEEPIVPEEPIAPEEPEQEPVQEPVQEPEKVSVTIVEQTVVNPVFIPEPAAMAQPQEEPKYETKTETYMETNETFEEKRGQNSHFLRDTLICILVLLLILGVGAYFVRDQLKGWFETLTQKDKTEVVVEENNDSELIDELPQDETEVPEIEEPAYQPTPKANEKKEPKSPAKPAVRPAQPSKSSKSSKVNTYGKKNPTEEEIRAEFMAISSNLGEELPPIASYPKLLAIEPIAEGSRMTWLAKKYYGSKIYWPYIYDANKDHLANPSLIEVGTPVRIPLLTSAQRDTTDAETMAHIERLRQEAEEASR